MHIITGPNGLVGAAAKRVCASVFPCLCVLDGTWLLCNTDYWPNTGKGEMEQGIDGTINGVRWKDGDGEGASWLCGGVDRD